jgi:hypothetical protein
MGFRNNAIATVWKVKDSDGESRFRDVQISTSRKDKKTGEHKSDFSGYVRFVAKAVVGVESLKEKDRIVLKNVDVGRKYDKDKGKEFVNFTVLEWERVENRYNNQEDQDQIIPETLECQGKNIFPEPEDVDEPPFA